MRIHLAAVSLLVGLLPGCSLLLEEAQNDEIDGGIDLCVGLEGDVGVFPALDPAECTRMVVTGLVVADPSTGDVISDMGLDIDFSFIAEMNVLRAGSIDIQGELIGVGREPLVLVAHTITISSGARVDVSSLTLLAQTRRGAGAIACPVASQGQSGPGSGGDGEAGGGGANSAPGGGGGTKSNVTVPGGQPKPGPPSAGCAGGSGAARELGGGPGLGGLGGGAVFLLATQLEVAGRIIAGGAGGHGSTDGAGGGGGGSGGLIHLDASSGTFEGGRLFANGGGGGAGSLTTTAVATHGRNGDVGMAGGGDSEIPSDVADGGDGSFGGPGSDGNAGNASAGGGGGGGGAGFIVSRIPGANFDLAMVSPPITDP